MINLKKVNSWEPDPSATKIQTIDMHTCGEPLRIIFGGFPLKGNTILEMRENARTDFDYLRTALMWEPRGHADMYGCIITPSVSEEADFGVLFLHNEGFSTMCGHGIIAVTKMAVETGFVDLEKPITPVNIDTPAGLVTAFARLEDKEVKSVYFQNVPSFVFALDMELNIAILGNIRFDIAYGGAFYAFVDADQLGLSLTSENHLELIEAGMKIKRAVMREFVIEHPYEKDLGFLYGTIFTGKAHSRDADSRNVCIFAEGEVDRSPTGTGVSARLAIEYARGRLGKNEPFIVESILGTLFSGQVIEQTNYGSHQAVIPQVEGTAFITGKHTFYIDPSDPLRDGFIFR